MGPLKNKKNELKYGFDEMAEILNDQYSSICTEPNAIINEDFMNDLLNNEHDSKLCDIYFSDEVINEAIKKLSCKSGPGPDGIPPHCLKYGGNLIITALTDIANISMRTSHIPNKLRGVWVTPIWKGQDLDNSVITAQSC